MIEEVPMIVTGIPIPPADEVRIEMREGNEALQAMNLHSTLPLPIIGGMTTLELTTQRQPITMAMAWASQD